MIPTHLGILPRLFVSLFSGSEWVPGADWPCPPDSIHNIFTPDSLCRPFLLSYIFRLAPDGRLKLPRPEYVEYFGEAGEVEQEVKVHREFLSLQRNPELSLRWRVRFLAL